MTLYCGWSTARPIRVTHLYLPGQGVGMTRSLCGHPIVYLRGDTPVIEIDTRLCMRCVWRLEKIVAA